MMEYKLKCNKCGHEWKPRSSELPKACPNCKSYLWDGKKTYEEGKK